MKSWTLFHGRSLLHCALRANQQGAAVFSSIGEQVSQNKRPKLSYTSVSNREISTSAQVPTKKVAGDGVRVLTSSTSSLFEDVLQCGNFVDKTGLIKAIFDIEEYPKILITCPRLSGKKLNLSMIQRFLELQVDKESGKKQTKAKDLSTDAIDDTTNYKLFTEVKGPLNVMQNEDFVKGHFGKYPIVRASFRCYYTVKNKENAVTVCRNAVHEAFKKHEYLYCTDSKLEEDEKKICKKWCSVLGDYEEFKEVDVMEGLKVLSSYLYKFHGRKCFVLIGQYDGIISNALYSVKNVNVLKKISEFSIGVIAQVMNDKNSIAGGLITGILDLHGVGISPLMGNLKRYNYGDSDLCMKFYGFTKEEVDKLFDDYNVEGELREKADKMYNCFCSIDGQRNIYNPFAVSSFLGNKALKDYWMESGYIQNFEGLFKVDAARNMIRSAVAEGGEPLIEIVKPLDLESIFELTAYESNKEPSTPDLICTFLLRLGYLTYAPKRDGDPENMTRIKVTNAKINDFFRNKLVDHFIQRHGLNGFLVNDIAYDLRVLWSLIDGDQTEFETKLANIQDNFGKLVRTANPPTDDHTTLSAIICNVFLAANFKSHSYEFNSPADVGKIPDVIAHKDGRGIAIVIKKNESSYDALEEAVDRYTVLFENQDIKVEICRLLMGFNFNLPRDEEGQEASVICLREAEIKELRNLPVLDPDSIEKFLDDKAIPKQETKESKENRIKRKK